MSVHKKHPELFHYTDWEGLSGIVASQTLWATHYKYLNDTTELQLMKPQLARRLFPLIKEILGEKYRDGELKNQGGLIKIAHDYAKGIADAFFEAAFEADEFEPPPTVPYITSFCSYALDHKYEQKNGLLSQWRGYGEGGGFAIVFDTKKLEKLRKKEITLFYYTSGGLGDVVYENDKVEFEEEFSGSIERLKSVCRNFSKTGEMGNGKVFKDILYLFTRFKHQAFYEEREVRLIFFPVTPEIKNRLRKTNLDYVSPDIPMKKIRHRKDGAPYIAAFDFGKKAKLPIKRIIVGPQKNQSCVAQEVQKMVGDRRIKICCSETPLRGT